MEKLPDMKGFCLLKLKLVFLCVFAEKRIWVTFYMFSSECLISECC